MTITSQNGKIVATLNGGVWSIKSPKGIATITESKISNMESLVSGLAKGQSINILMSKQ